MAAAVDALVSEAARAGVRLSGTGWRSSADQRELRRRNCGTSRYAVEDMPANTCRPPTARPGESRHEWGLAVDLKAMGPGTVAAEWMHRNAARYGLFNLPGEPWHWSVDGQ
jgi:LAS superfamily LD-carboxypeptidase LdcB